MEECRHTLLGAGVPVCRCAGVPVCRIIVSQQLRDAKVILKEIGQWKL